MPVRASPPMVTGADAHSRPIEPIAVWAFIRVRDMGMLPLSGPPPPTGGAGAGWDGNGGKGAARTGSRGHAIIAPV
ncbi:hypothetical protein AA16373_1369 [Komagataeibacter swingsii DSM 16373]|nr:hypothetical protein AA16373_1369 [Komagataeibacter swingsii DSM 16373]